MSVQSWLEGVVEDAVKAAVDAALDDVKDDIVAEIQATEQNLFAQMTSLPQQVIAGVLQGIPDILNPFKGH